MKQKEEKTQKLIEGSIEIVKNDKGFINLYLNTSKYGRLNVVLNDYANPKKCEVNRKLLYKMFMECK